MDGDVSLLDLREVALLGRRHRLAFGRRPAGAPIPDQEAAASALSGDDLGWQQMVLQALGSFACSTWQNDPIDDVNNTVIADDIRCDHGGVLDFERILVPDRNQSAFQACPIRLIDQRLLPMGS